jgi:hypothetical protein
VLEGLRYEKSTVLLILESPVGGILVFIFVMTRMMGAVPE